MSEQAVGTHSMKLVNRLRLKASLLFIVTLAHLVSGCSPFRQVHLFEGGGGSIQGR
jgi:hypothetical protein